MFNKKFSSQMQIKDKKGPLNPIYGIKKSSETIKKLQKYVYVYEANTLKKIGIFTIIECIKHFKMGKGTFYKYLNTQ